MLVEDGDVLVGGAVLELLVEIERELAVLRVREDGEVVGVVGRDRDLRRSGSGLCDASHSFGRPSSWAGVASIERCEAARFASKS